MAKNTIADLDVTAANNTDVLNQSTAGTATVSTIDNMIRNLMAVVARFYSDIGGLATVGGSANVITLTSASTYQTLESGLVMVFEAGADNTGATTLNLDGLGAKAVRKIVAGADVAVVVGDIKAAARYTVIYDADANSSSGGWILVNAPSAGWELISTQTPSGASAVVWTGLSAYRKLRLTGFVTVSVDGVGVGVRTSTDNGSNYDASTGYSNQNLTSEGTSTASAIGSTDSAVLLYASSVGSASGEGIMFSVLVDNFNQSRPAWFISDTMYRDTGGAIERHLVGSSRNDSVARNALQFLAFSGNVTGHVTLEGVRG